MQERMNEWSNIQLCRLIQELQIQNSWDSRKWYSSWSRRFKGRIKNMGAALQRIQMPSAPRWLQNDQTVDHCYGGLQGTACLFYPLLLLPSPQCSKIIPKVTHSQTGFRGQGHKYQYPRTETASYNKEAAAIAPQQAATYMIDYNRLSHSTFPSARVQGKRKGKPKCWARKYSSSYKQAGFLGSNQVERSV